MRVCLYQVTLLDPLFYAREGLAGAYTPPLLHATAVNLAVCSALNRRPDRQPLVISEANGGRNVPRYEHSWVDNEFYFTPAMLRGPIRYFPEITKGEKDGFAVVTDIGSELFKASTLFYITPESKFEGFCFLLNDIEMPQVIRLGSFRGKATLTFNPVKIVGKSSHRFVDHLVDPLVTSCQRGVLENVFPYPLVRNALVARAYLVLAGNRNYSVAPPDEMEIELVSEPLPRTGII